MDELLIWGIKAEESFAIELRSISMGHVQILGKKGRNARNVNEVNCGGEIGEWLIMYLLNWSIGYGSQVLLTFYKYFKLSFKLILKSD